MPPKKESLMTWNVDPVHTHIGFSVRHLMISTVRGQFKSYSGKVAIDPADFTKTTIEGEVEVKSIDTGNEQRDGHLRTNDFFDAEHHPKITFKSSRIEKKGEAEYLVHGDLQIRGVTKPVTFEAEFLGVSKSPRGQTVAGLHAHAMVQRKDFGVLYDAVLETGGVAIADKVKIEIDAEFVAA
jgi:polyisoprenoid-binding protein YceI